MSAERSCDLIVAGATLGGCLTALAAARRGARVVLVEASPFLGTDLTAVLRPWVGGTPAAAEPARALRDLLSPPAEAAEVDVDPASLPPDWPRETALFRGSIRKSLLAALDAAGVTTLLQCTPAGVLCAGDRASGLLVACKQGLLLLRAPALVDATAGADVLRLWQPSAVPAPARQRGHFTLGLAGADWPPTPAIDVDPSLGLADHRVTFHAGRNSASSLFAEFALDLAAAAPGTPRRRWRAEVELRARRTAVALTTYLVRHVPALAKATLVETAAEVRLPPPACPAAAALPGGLWRGPDPVPAEVTWRDLAALGDAAERGAAAAVPAGPAAAAGVPATEIRSGSVCLPLGGCRLSPLDDPALGLPAAEVQLGSLTETPVADTCDVLVAGGGTAGANAAVAALDAGAATVVLEQLSDLGGTQTLGLVAGYYHGYRGGFTAVLDERVGALGQAMHNGRPGNRRLVKMLHYLQAVVDRGGRWYPGAVVCGGVVDTGRVYGLLAADRDGLFRVQAKVTLDATGDGDAAAFCGVRTTFGDPRSGTAQDYSQWSLGRGGWETLAPDLDVIDQRLLSEVLRGLRIAHRRGRWFDFAAMLTVREGRHIDGEYTLDLRDILAGRSFDDTLAVASTDWDPHGPSTSWLGRLGFLPLQTAEIPVRIPLRCCIPRGLTGLLVTAKAISATPDAACLCRMAPDVQNLGYATGLAAAAAAAADGDPRRLDLAALTTRLHELGIVTAAAPAPWPTAADASAAVQRLAAGDEMALRDVVLLDAAAALPRLEAAFATPGTDRTNLAKALAWFGSPLGNDLLVTALSRLAAAEVLPYDDSHPHKPGKPRAGMIDGPDDFWRVNQLLVLLGLARARDAADAVAAVIARADAGGPPVRAINAYIRDRIDMQRVPHFDRLLSIAFCAERLGEPRLAPALDHLLDREFIGGHAGPGLDDAGRRYQGALAEVLLAAGAARCGSRHGALRLAAFLDDAHAILARFAASELRAISGQEYGGDRVRWERWLQGDGSLEPRPLAAGLPVF